MQSVEVVLAMSNKGSQMDIVRNRMFYNATNYSF